MAASSVRVFLVTSGSDWPHAALDAYVVDGLRSLGCTVGVFDLYGWFLHHATRSGPPGLAGSAHTMTGALLSACRRAWVEASRWSPDLVLLCGGVVFAAGVVREMRAAGHRVVAWCTDDPYHLWQTLQLAPVCDAIFTIESAAVPLYRDRGAPLVHHLPLGCCPAVHRPEDVPPAYRSPVCFVGSAFPNRLQLLDEAARFLGGRTRLVGPGWERLRHGEQYRDLLVPRTVPPREAARYFCGAQVNLNLHRAPPARAAGGLSAPQARTPNARTFEIAACGGFQIVDASRSADLRRLFPGGEIPEFGSTGELEHLVRRYLGDPAEAAVLGARARAVALSRHTYRHRLAELLAVATGKDLSAAEDLSAGAPDGSASTVSGTRAGALPGSADWFGPEPLPGLDPGWRGLLLESVAGGLATAGGLAAGPDGEASAWHA